MRYRADPADARRSIEADGVVLIYHRPSGITHVVGTPVPEILAALDDAPADARTLLARLPADWGLGEDALPLIEARLGELVATGLIAAA